MISQKVSYIGKSYSFIRSLLYYIIDHFFSARRSMIFQAGNFGIPYLVCTINAMDNQVKGLTCME